MAGGSSTLSTFIGAAAGAIIAVAGSAVVLFNLAEDQRAQFRTQLAALDAKLDKTSAAVAEMGKSANLADTAKELGQLNLEIKKTNAGLVDLQKASSSDGVKSALGQLDGKIEKASASVASLNTALQSSLTAQAAAQKQALDAIAASVDQVKATTSEAQQAARQQASERASAPAKSDAAVPKAADSRELVVVYVPQAGASDTTASIPVSPLSVRFEKIGAVNPGPQTDAIVTNLKSMIKDKHGCTVSVAGYADTLGNDKINLAVSRERAESVAAKLRAGFAGQDVQVKEVAWGERQLKVWTPDGRGEKANRRVDISVDCKS